MALRYLAILLVFFSCYHHANCGNGTQDSSGNRSKPVPPRLVKAEQPSDLVHWYDMSHSFIEGMYVSGKTPLIILWLNRRMASLNKSENDDGQIFVSVNREGHRRMFQNGRSAVFIIFLILVLISLIISGWFVCGYRIIGLCGTRPAHPLDDDQAVVFRICMFVIMVGLIIGILVLIYFALANTVFAHRAFSSKSVINEMKNELNWIDSWVSNFSGKYAGNGTAQRLAPTKGDILKAVTDAYRGYYGYVFEKAGLHLLEYEVKVLSKYMYYTFQSYYQIEAIHAEFIDKKKKIAKIKKDFASRLENFLNTCQNCDYYLPFRNRVVFRTSELNESFSNFITGISALGRDGTIFKTHFELITKRIQDILLQIPQNKSLYRGMIGFIKNASDTYYAATFKNIQWAISQFVTTFNHLTSVLRLPGNVDAIVNAHLTRHAFTIIFCIAIILAIVNTLVALVLGCVFPPRPLSAGLAYNKYRCRELPATMLNVSAIIIFITIVSSLLFVIVIFIIGVPFEWGYCRYLENRDDADKMDELENYLKKENANSNLRGLFVSLLGRCLQGRGTLFEMLHLFDDSDWNSTYTFLKNLKQNAEDIYNVPEYMEKFPAKHPFFEFCDFYSKAISKDLQTATYKLPGTTLNLHLENHLTYQSHELPLEMKILSDRDTDDRTTILYNNFVTIVAMDLLRSSLKKSYDLAHPWRYLPLHLQNVKDLYNKSRTWFYSPARINSTRNMFLKYSAAALNRLFKDALKRDMPCTGIGQHLDVYFYDFCKLIVDPWNATWLIFLILLLLLLLFLLGIFILIICYRKQSDRKLSDAQHMLKHCCGMHFEGDDVPPPPPPKKKKSEEKQKQKEDSDSDSSVAIIGFNHGCYIFCRTFTICSNFLVYLLLCKWKDRKKRAKRMNADPKKRRSISELPVGFFPAPVVVPLGCGPHLVGKCCCLNLETKKKSELEEESQKRKKKKKKKRKRDSHGEDEELVPRRSSKKKEKSSARQIAQGEPAPDLLVQETAERKEKSAKKTSSKSKSSRKRTSESKAEPEKVESEQEVLGETSESHGGYVQKSSEGKVHVVSPRESYL